MIRLHKEQAARILYYLIWVRDQLNKETPTDPPPTEPATPPGPTSTPWVVVSGDLETSPPSRSRVDIWQDLLNRWYRGPHPIKEPDDDLLVRDIVRDFMEISHTLHMNTAIIEDIDLLDDMVFPDRDAPEPEWDEDLDQPRKSPSKEGALIDAIADTIMSPYGRHVMDGPTLKELRRVVLLPEESAGLVERLKKKELHCSRCGWTFIRGDTAVIRLDTYDGGGRDMIPGLMCARCCRPDYLPCSEPSCDQRVSFPPSFFKTPRVCETHKKSRGLDAASPLTTIPSEGLDPAAAPANPVREWIRNDRFRGLDLETMNALTQADPDQGDDE